MDFGNKIIQLRKEKSISREDIAKQVGTSGAIIGRYERNEIVPSVKIAAKIAEALGVSLDYLVGSTDLLLDKTIIDRIEEIQKLNPEDKGHIFALLDAFLRDTSAKKVYK